MANGIGKNLTKNLKSLVSTQTLKEGALVAAGGVATPITSGILVGLLNRMKPGMINPVGMGGKVLDLLSSAVVATVASAAAKSPNVARLMMLGGISGVFSDIAVESIVPMVGLSDYLQLPGMSDYVKLPGVSDYLSVKSNGMADWASVGDVANAGPAYEGGETF